MAIRFAQMALAIFGMWLILMRGAVREPGFGSGGGVPVHWTFATAPLLLGALCIAVALALIWARDKA
jgi:hypothetical protein